MCSLEKTEKILALLCGLIFCDKWVFRIAATLFGHRCPIVRAETHFFEDYYFNDDNDVATILEIKVRLLNFDNHNDVDLYVIDEENLRQEFLERQHEFI